MAATSQGLRSWLFLENKQYNKAAGESGKKTEELGQKGVKATGDISKGMSQVSGVLEGMTYRIGGVAGQFARMFSGITSGSAAATAGLLAVAGGVAAVTTAVKTSMRAIDAYGEQQHAERLAASQMRALGGTFSQRNESVKAIMNRLSDESGYDEVPLLAAMTRARGMGAGSFNAVENLTREGMRLAEIEGDQSGDAASKMVTAIAGVSGAWGGSYGAGADWITRLSEMTGQNVSFLERPIAKSLTGAGLGYGQDFMGGLMTEAFQSGMIPRTAASAVENLVTELVKPNSVLGQMFRDRLGMPLAEASGETQLQVLKDIAKNTDPQEVNLTTTTAPLWGVLANLNPEIARQFSAGSVAGSADQRYADIVEGSIVSERRKSKEVVGDIMEEIGAAVYDQVLPPLAVLRDEMKAWISTDAFKHLAESLGDITAKATTLAFRVLPPLVNMVTNFANAIFSVGKVVGHFLKGLDSVRNFSILGFKPFKSIVSPLNAMGEALDYFMGDDWMRELGDALTDGLKPAADTAAVSVSNLVAEMNKLNSSGGTGGTPQPAYSPTTASANWATIAAGARLAQSASHYLQGRGVSTDLINQAMGLRDYFSQQFASGGISDREQGTLNAMLASINRMKELNAQQLATQEEIEANTSPQQDMRLYSSPILSTDDILVGG